MSSPILTQRRKERRETQSLLCALCGPLRLCVKVMLLACLLSSAHAQTYRARLDITAQFTTGTRANNAVTSLNNFVPANDRFTNELKTVTAWKPGSNTVAATFIVADTNRAQAAFERIRTNTWPNLVRANVTLHYCPSEEAPRGWLGCKDDPRANHQTFTLP